MNDLAFLMVDWCNSRVATMWVGTPFEADAGRQPVFISFCTKPVSVDLGTMALETDTSDFKANFKTFKTPVAVLV